MTVTVRTLEPAEVAPAHHMLEQAFGGAAHPDDSEIEHSVVDPTRFYGAFDGEEIVGTAGSFDFSMTVPGGQLPVAGVTWVGVQATHRRRGVLHAMMSRQLGDLHESGTAVAALWASEAGIYGRYGYGTASWLLRLSLPSGAALRTAVAPGGLRLVEPDAPEVRATYDAVAARTPGFPARGEQWWRFRVHDPEHRRDGAGPLQCVATDGGYALYSTVSRWSEAGLPVGVVKVREVLATSAAAAARLWRYLLDLDLMHRVDVYATGPDDPLVLSLLAEPRRARAGLRDNLHVRLIDVAAALSGRRYATDVDVVLQVEDERCPWNTGRWRLSGGREGASCERAVDEPDLVLTPADLGAAYLGGTPLRSRAVEERTPGALSRATTAFGPLDAAPWCPQVF